MRNRTYHPRGVLIEGYTCLKHPLHVMWAGMLSRCYNANSENYKYYGGRGITVCNRWHNFRFFVEDMGQKPTPGHSIERRDNDLGYFPDNCKWATSSEQCSNRSKFKTNTSGVTGVSKIDGRFHARFDFEHRRYLIGKYDSLDAAQYARDAFVDLFFKDKSAAVASVPEYTPHFASTTGIRGVTPHADGGYIARCTQNGVRKYLGYFATIESASAAIQKAKQ